MKRNDGFTLIELMVAVTIGLFVTLASMSLLASSEQHRRTQSSVTGMDQSSQYFAYTLDSQIRNAGSGFAQSWQFAFGCELNGTIAGTQIFPLPTMPAPFAGVPAAIGTFRLAPVIILQGASASGSDVLVIAAGAAGFGEVPIQFGSAPTSSALNLVGTTSLSPSDIVLVADQNTGSNITPCMIEQVDSAFAAGSTITQVAMGGSYYTSSGASRSLTDFSADGLAMSLGNVAGANPPTFTLLGVGANDLTATGATTGSTLYSYDLMSAGATPMAIVDGVVELRALYGIDDVGDGLVHTWQDPAAGNYAPAVLLDGSTASAQLLQRIKAIRVGLIVRTNLKERADAATNPSGVSPATLTLFADLPGLTYTRDLSGADDRNYRYRVIESTIPLRNTLLTTN